MLFTFGKAKTKILIYLLYKYAYFRIIRGNLLPALQMGQSIQEWTKIEFVEDSL